MIVADSNVISEMMRPVAEPAVVAWFDAQDYGTVSMTAPGLAEIRYGIERLPHSRRREKLEQSFAFVLRRLLSPEILVFDADAALAYGRIVSRREAAGRPVQVVDAMIAAICLANGAMLATRNVRDFEGLDLKLANPFETA